MHFPYKRAFSLALFVFLLAFGPLCASAQAAPFTLEQITPQLARLEQLANEYAAQQVVSQAPELAGLQNLALVSLPTKEAVDFVHLIVTIGATCQSLPVRIPC